MIHTFPQPTIVRRWIVAAAVSASVVACASSSSGAPAEKTASQPASSRYVLVQADIDRAKADNAYDLITKLRPDFLRGRNENTSFVQQATSGGSKDPGGAPGGSSSSTGTAVLASGAAVMVYKDNVRLGGVDDLRQIQLSTIREIRYLPGPDAIIRFGANHSAGAILVTSR